MLNIKISSFGGSGWHSCDLLFYFYLVKSFIVYSTFRYTSLYVPITAYLTLSVRKNQPINLSIDNLHRCCLDGFLLLHILLVYYYYNILLIVDLPGDRSCAQILLYFKVLPIVFYKYILLFTQSRLCNMICIPLIIQYNNRITLFHCEKLNTYNNILLT